MDRARVSVCGVGGQESALKDPHARGFQARNRCGPSTRMWKCVELFAKTPILLYDHLKVLK